MVKEQQTETAIKSVALLGNPNCGKSSLFNQLTGLSQKVGNFPGVTVDKRYGSIYLSNEEKVHVVDFPGTYSFYPTALDERIVVQSLLDQEADNHPDAVLYVADLTKLEKHLLLFSQLKDLGIPVALVLNMSDIAERDGLQLNRQQLAKELGVPVVMVSSRTGQGIEQIPGLIENLLSFRQAHTSDFKLIAENRSLIKEIKELFPRFNDYRALLVAHHADWLPFLTEAQRKQVRTIVERHQFQSLRGQVDETMSRFDAFSPIIRRNLIRQEQQPTDLSARLDQVLTHRIMGPIIFFLMMLLVFQAIYAWAAYPMDGIEWLFAVAGESVSAVLPEG